MFHTGLIDIARRVRPAIRVGVRQSHVANTERVVIAQEAQAVNVRLQLTLRDSARGWQQNIRHTTPAGLAAV